MKFSRILGNLLAEIFPEWREMFVSYKSLKKQLNLIYPKPGIGIGIGIAERDCEERPVKRPRVSDSDAEESVAAAAESSDESEVRKEVVDFIRLLDEEIEKFNRFFLKKEEDYVIAWRELRDRIRKAKDSNEDLSNVGRTLVDFHGELVLLEIYSILNYTGLVKITKKHDKRSSSGTLIRFPFIQTVLGQPFFSTEVVNKLVKDCEEVLDDTFTQTELAQINHLDSIYVKLTLLALQVLDEIRNGSSTVSALSLPPLNNNVADDLARPLLAG